MTLTHFQIIDPFQICRSYLSYKHLFLIDASILSILASMWSNLCRKGVNFTSKALSIQFSRISWKPVLEELVQLSQRHPTSPLSCALFKIEAEKGPSSNSGNNVNISIRTVKFTNKLRYQIISKSYKSSRCSFQRNKKINNRAKY